MPSEPTLADATSRDATTSATGVPLDLRRRITGPTGVVDLLDCDADLAQALRASPEGGAPPQVIATTVSLPRGPWQAPRRAEPLALGLLVLEGLLIRRISYGRASCGELLGPGDLLRPWLEDGGGVIGPRVGWRVLEPARLALLNGGVGKLCASHPEVVGELLNRALVRGRRQGILNAIAATNRIDERVLLLFGHIAERWGRVTGTGILIALPFTHAVIAELVGARRPTVTTALSELRHAGALERGGEAWMLTKAGRARLDVLAQASLD